MIKRVVTWRTFDSAPKTGEEILVYSSECAMQLAYWHDAGQMWLGDDGDVLFEGHETPLYWCALPSPPWSGEMENVS